MRTYLLFAGVNGAGKSTLYRTLAPDVLNMPRVNTNEIVKTFGDWRNLGDVIKAGKIAIRQIEDNFSSGISFNQETTLCGASVMKNILRAKKSGYAVIVHYVGLNLSPLRKSALENESKMVATVFLTKILTVDILKVVKPLMTGSHKHPFTD